MNTEKFIRNATRGVSRRKREEAQAELRSHLHERTNQLILAGKPLPSAQAQAMQELGPPTQIARGLRRTEHVHPLLSALVLCGLVGLLAYVPLNLLETERDLRNGFSSNMTAAQLRGEGFVTVNEARQRLKGGQVQLTGFGPLLKLTAEGLPDVPLNTCSEVEMANPQPLLELRPSHLYVQPSIWPGCLARAGWPLQLTPESVTFRGQALDFIPERGEMLVLGSGPEVWQSWVYHPALESALGEDLFPVLPWRWRAPQTYTVARPDRTPVALLVRLRGKVPNRFDMGMALAWVEGGKVTFPTRLLEDKRTAAESPIVLYTSLSEWRKASSAVYAGLVIPLPTNSAEPVHLTPLSLTPTDM